MKSDATRFTNSHCEMMKNEAKLLNTVYVICVAIRTRGCFRLCHAGKECEFQKRKNKCLVRVINNGWIMSDVAFCEEKRIDLELTMSIRDPFGIPLTFTLEI